MEDILEMLKTQAQSKAHLYPLEVFSLRALWRTSYVLRLTEEDAVFHLHYVLAQTVEQGCCYYDVSREQVGLSESLLGQNALEVQTEHRSIKIAALDAVYASMRSQPAISHTLDGTNTCKAHRRAEIVCEEVYSILAQRQPKYRNKMKVANVGVVGSFLSILMSNRNLQVTASDFYQGVVKQRVHDVRVEEGHKTLELVADADLAIVTGMTLANNTLGSILQTARESQTAIVLFAETGASFAPEYCRIGIDSVISEPFPFYLSCGGRTHINIYRRTSQEG